RRGGLVLGTSPFDPPLRGPAPNPIERGKERVVEIVEHPYGRVAIPCVWAQPRGGEHRPVPREEVDVVIGDRVLTKCARLAVLTHRRRLRDSARKSTRLNSSHQI